MLLLSPHLDDAVFSLGGLIHAWVQAGQRVEIWTVCAADPPDAPLSPFAQALHTRWGLGREAAALRRAEDLRPGALLGDAGLPGVAARHLDFPDCIYRRHPRTRRALYASEAAIFGKLAAVEAGLVEGLAGLIDREAPRGASVLCPLGLGNHVDHQLTRRAAELSGRRVTFYADLPYVLTEEAKIASRVPAGFHAAVHPVSAEGLAAWGRASAAYASQIGSFWADEAVMRAQIAAYAARSGGVRLWAGGTFAPD
jgi:LmbE family N-acetylglucosaminyl deacetylase